MGGLPPDGKPEERARGSLIEEALCMADGGVVGYEKGGRVGRVISGLLHAAEDGGSRRE